MSAVSSQIDSRVPELSAMWPPLKPQGITLAERSREVHPTRAPICSDLSDVVPASKQANWGAAPPAKDAAAPGFFSARTPQIVASLDPHRLGERQATAGGPGFP